MSFSCYVIDDELHAAKLIGQFISDTEGLVLAGISTRPLNALQELETGAVPDLIFLDIDMPKMDGLSLAARLKRKAHVVFTTAYREHAADAFDQEAIDYLLKPISYARFLQCIEHIRAIEANRAPSSATHLFVKSGSRAEITRVAFDDIRYISALSAYTEIFLKEGKLIVYTSLKELSDQMPDSSFSRIHKSYLVNHEFIRSVKGQMLLLDNEFLPIGRAYRAAFLEKLKWGYAGK